VRLLNNAKEQRSANHRGQGRTGIAAAEAPPQVFATIRSHQFAARR